MRKKILLSLVVGVSFLQFSHDVMADSKSPSFSNRVRGWVGWHANPLIDAVEAEDLNTIKILAKKESELLSQTGKHGTTPLITALKMGSFPMVESLIALGAGVNQTGELDFSEVTPAKAAIQSDVLAKQGNTRKMIELLKEKGADLHQGHLIIAAIEAENVDVVRYLIDEKVSCDEVKASLKEGESTPLTKAILVKDGLDIFHVIIGQKPNVNQTVNINGKDWSPLAFAVNNKRELITKELLKLGADVNKGIMFGDLVIQTPLSLAVKKKSFKLVELLLKNRADVNQPVLNKTHGGRTFTPLTLSILSDDLPIFYHLIENGADVNQAIITHGQQSITPLGLAVITRRLKMGKRLVRRNADVNVGITHKNESFSPLGLAFAATHGKFVRFLLAKGADDSVLDNIDEEYAKKGKI